MPPRVLQHIAPMPMRFTRAHYEKLIENLYEQRDRAEGARRADRDRVAAMLEGAADAHAADADHLDRLTGNSRGATVEKLTAGGHRAVACVLRDLARDVAEERP